MELYLGDGPILSKQSEVIVQKSGVYCPSGSGDHVLEIELRVYRRRHRQTFCARAGYRMSSYLV